MQRSKKLYVSVLILGICLLFGFFSITVFCNFSNDTMSAATGTPDANSLLYYTYNSTSSTYSVTDCSLTAVSVIIPLTFDDGTNGIHSVTSIGNSAFSSCTNLTSVSIPDSINAIGDSAFYYCSKLTLINIPAGVLTIGSNIFRDCKSLSNITVDVNNPNYCSLNGALLNKDQTILLSYANMYSTSYDLPDSVLTINHSAFGDCSNLTTVNISNTSLLTSIGGAAFWGCDKLTTINIPDDVTIIDASTFSNCTALGTVNISNTSKLTSIGFQAFYSCENLISINIPDTVTSISGQAFYNCKKLGTVNISNTSILTDIFGSAFKNCTSLTSISIPDGVSTLWDSTFENCANLATVTISNTSGLTTIKTNSFYKCTSLTSISLPDGVSTIGNNAFEQCSYLTTVNISNTTALTSIGVSAFRYCTNLSIISLPENVSTIGSSAFYQCTNLSSINIPEHVNSIGTSAFYNCTSLSNITVDENNLYFCSLDGALLDKDKTTIIIYANMHSTSYTLPDSVLTISNNAFYACSNLTTINILNTSGLTSIGSSAFYQCTNLSSINIPEHVNSIENFAFQNCTSLSNITVDESNLNFCSLDGALLDKDKTTIIIYANMYSTSYTLPDSVLTISKYAFFACTNLTTVNISSTAELSTIGTFAFYQCTSLTSIYFPDSITNIGYAAFDYCSLLNKLAILATTPPTLTSSHISSNSGITSSSGYIYVPDDSVNAYKTATNWSYFANRIFGASELTFNVEFDANGGTGTMPDQVFNYGVANNLNANTFARTSYKFMGWSTTSGGAVEYADGASYTFSALSDTILYAVWEELTQYTINFYGNGSTSGSMGTQNFYEGESYVIAENVFLKTGYIFMGWSTTSGGAVEYAGNALVSDLVFAGENTSIDLYAVWTVNTNTAYSVEYYQQNILNDEYTLFTTSNLTGTAFESVSAVINTFIGFTHITNANSLESGTIAGDGSLVLKVYYDRQIFTVTFINESSSYDIQNIRYQGSATTPTNPTKPSTAQYTYTFTGWDTVYTDVTENLTVTAVYSSAINSYDVIFKNYDNTTLKTQSVVYGEDATPPNIPTRTGYTFTGWSGSYTNITGATTVTALYEINEYTITFNGNGATSGTMSNQIFTYGISANLTKNDFTRTGYRFGGWTWDDNTYADEGNILNLTTINDVTLTFVAIWLANIYTIQFDANGGNGSMANQILTYGISANLTKNDFTRTGYHFGDWTWNNNTYADEESVLNLTSTNNSTLTFVAVWELNTNTAYSVEYYQQNILDDEYTLLTTSNLTGTTLENVSAVINLYTGFIHITNANSLESGAIAEDGSLVLKVYYNRQTFTVTFINEGSIYNTQTIRYQGSATTPTNPTKPSTAQYTYTFTGWDTVYIDVTENLTVTAVYSSAINSYDVIFKDYDNTILKTQSVVYGEDATPPTSPTRTGYTFTGWSDSYTNITSATTIIALYDINNYAITFNGNGATSGTMLNQTFDFGSTQNLTSNAFLWEGYAFQGWATSGVRANSGIVDYTDCQEYTYVVADNITLYAVWAELTQYTINYYGNGATSGAMVAIQFYEGETTNLSVLAFVRTDYTFQGWSTTPNGSVIYADQESISSDDFDGFTSLDLYAIWVENIKVPYVVEYYQQNILNDEYTLLTSSNSTGTVSTIVNATINTYTGFTHITNANSLESGTITGDGSLVLKVYYDRQTFIVTFINEGSIYNTQIIKYQGSAITPTNQTKPSTAQYTYTFTGWDTAYTNVTENLTVTAVYSSSINSYDVTFKDYDNTILKTQSVVYGEDAIPPSDPTRTGYTFTGWSDSYTNITGTTTIIALYSANEYVLTFNSNGGDSVENPLIIEYGSEISSLPTPTKSGYIFKGWYFNGVKIEIGDSFTLTDNIQLTAEWQKDITPLSIFYMILSGIGVIGGITGIVLAIHFIRKRATIKNWDKTHKTPSNDTIK